MVAMGQNSNITLCCLAPFDRFAPYHEPASWEGTSFWSGATGIGLEQVKAAI
jgi:hypothetical protein